MTKCKTLNRVLAASFLSVLASSACQALDDRELQQANESESTPSGSLEFFLLSVGESGASYRLRNATLMVEGPNTSLQLSTETNPNGTAISAEVPVGAYQLLLQEGWQLEKLVTGAAAQAVEAQLLSANPISFNVAEGVSTPVALRFKVGEEEVGPSGSFEVVLEVEEVDAGTDTHTDTDTDPGGGETCESCSVAACSAELTACADPGNQSKCTNLTACFEAEDCAVGALTSGGVVEPCFCGTFGALDCAGGYADGPCLAVGRLAASASANPANVLNTLVRWDDPSFAAGDAKNLVMCQIENCASACEHL